MRKSQVISPSRQDAKDIRKSIYQSGNETDMPCRPRAAYIDVINDHRAGCAAA
jgi:hypothetical protein